MKTLIFFLFIPLTPLMADFGIKTQAELHGKYQTLDFDLQDYQVYLRLEKAFSLRERAQLYTRLDIPYISLWGKKTVTIAIDEDGIVDSVNTPATKKEKVPLKEKGLGDILIRAFYVTPPLGSKKRDTLGVGSELIFPSAQKPDIGTGKYAARPLVGIKHDLPHLREGAWVAILFKYQFSFAGDKERPSFQIFFIQPVFVYPLGRGWTLSITPEIQMSVRTRKWFVPATAAFTKTFPKNFSFTFQYQRGVVRDFPVFKDEVEATLRYTF